MSTPKDLGDIGLSVARITGTAVDVDLTISPQNTSVSPAWIGVSLRWDARTLTLAGSTFKQSDAVTISKLPAGWSANFPIQASGNNLNAMWNVGRAYLKAVASGLVAWKITQPTRIAALHFKWMKAPADTRIEIDDLQWTSLYGWRGGAWAELTGQRNGVLIVP